jgi:hypothetical protein
MSTAYDLRFRKSWVRKTCRLRQDAARGEARRRSAKRDGRRWWPGTGSNCRPHDFQSRARTTELPGLRQAVYGRACHWRKRANLDTTSCRCPIGESLAEPDRQGKGQNQASRDDVDDWRLIGPEEVVEDPLRKSLDAWA